MSDVVSAARVGGAREQLSGKLLPRRKASFIFSKYRRLANVHGIIIIRVYILVYHHTGISFQP